MVKLLHLSVNPCLFMRTMRCHFNSAKMDETIAALLHTHRFWNAFPDLIRVQCEPSNMLTWALKNIHTANGGCANLLSMLSKSGCKVH